MRGQCSSARLLRLSADRPFIRDVVDYTSRRVSVAAAPGAPSRSALPCPALLCCQRWRLSMAAWLCSESLLLLLFLLLVHRSEAGRGRQAEQRRPWLRLWTRVAGCGLT
ncbi:hypothetical protein J3F84DRAFT_382916 [Trichoderma pleuroticola]